MDCERKKKKNKQKAKYHGKVDKHILAYKLEYLRQEALKGKYGSAYNAIHAACITVEFELVCRALLSSLY